MSEVNPQYAVLDGGAAAQISETVVDVLTGWEWMETVQIGAKTDLLPDDVYVVVRDYDSLRVDVKRNPVSRGEPEEVPFRDLLTDLHTVLEDAVSQAGYPDCQMTHQRPETQADRGFPGQLVTFTINVT